MKNFLVISDDSNHHQNAFTIVEFPSGKFNYAMFDKPTDFLKFSALKAALRLSRLAQIVNNKEVGGAL
jgi:hypothetical protein